MRNCVVKSLFNFFKVLLIVCARTFASLLTVLTTDILRSCSMWMRIALTMCCGYTVSYFVEIFCKKKKKMEANSDSIWTFSLVWLHPANLTASCQRESHLIFINVNSPSFKYLTNINTNIECCLMETFCRYDF